MKVIEEVDKITWASNGHTDYCHLPLHMIQHLRHAHELNRGLIELVKFLAMEHRVIKASLCVHNENEMEKNHKMEYSRNVIVKLLHKQQQWIKVTKVYYLQQKQGISQNKMQQT